MNQTSCCNKLVNRDDSRIIIDSYSSRHYIILSSIGNNVQYYDNIRLHQIRYTLLELNQYFNLLEGRIEG